MKTTVKATLTAMMEKKKSRKSNSRQAMDCFSGKSTETPTGIFIAYLMLNTKHNLWHLLEWVIEIMAKLRGDLILRVTDSKVPKFSELVKILQKHFD